jgi:hypothetical protein
MEKEKDLKKLIQKMAFNLLILYYNLIVKNNNNGKNK